MSSSDSASSTTWPTPWRMPCRPSSPRNRIHWLSPHAEKFKNLVSWYLRRASHGLCSDDNLTCPTRPTPYRVPLTQNLQHLWYEQQKTSSGVSDMSSPERLIGGIGKRVLGRIEKCIYSSCRLCLQYHLLCLLLVLSITLT
jgi:hypothetical protein